MFIDDVDQYFGAVDGEPLGGDRRFAQFYFHGPLRFHIGSWIRQTNGAGAAYSNGFQILGPHNRTHAGAAYCAVQIIHNTSETYELLACWTDAGDDSVWYAQLGLEMLLGFSDGFAPEM